MTGQKPVLTMAKTNSSRYRITRRGVEQAVTAEAVQAKGKLTSLRQRKDPSTVRDGETRAISRRAPVDGYS